MMMALTCLVGRHGAAASSDTIALAKQLSWMMTIPLARPAGALLLLLLLVDGCGCGRWSFFLANVAQPP